MAIVRSMFVENEGVLRVLLTNFIIKVFAWISGFICAKSHVCSCKKEIQSKCLAL
jgi:hypothetical protein